MSQKNGHYAKAVSNLGRVLGGEQGRVLQTVALMARNGPRLSTLTRKSRLDGYASAILRHLGAYSTGRIPLATLKSMRRDPQLRLGLAASTSPIIGASLYFDSPSKELKALATDVFLETGTLRELQRTSINQGLAFGFAAHEKLWELEPSRTVRWVIPGKDIGSAERKEKTYTQLFSPRRYKDLDPSEVTLVQGDDGSLVGLLYGDKANTTTREKMLERVRRGSRNALPVEKLFLFTLESEWDDLYGYPRLAAAYDPWFWQKVIYLVANRWYERKSDPPYVAYAPAGPILTEESADDENAFDETEEALSPIRRMAVILEQLRSSGWAVLPSEPFMDNEGRPTSVRAYDVKELGVEDMHPVFLDYIDHLDVKKMRALLIPDSAIMQSSGAGTYGSVKAMAEIAVKVQTETLNAFVRHVNQHILRQWREYNGFKDPIVLRTGGISSDNRDVLLDVLTKMYEGDMLFEQAYGPVLANSLPRMIDRHEVARALDIPINEPDPDAPLPTLPAPAPGSPAATADAAAKAKAVQTKAKSSGKRDAGYSYSPERMRRVALARQALRTLPSRRKP